jgi:hypothetical protein
LSRRNITVSFDQTERYIEKERGGVVQIDKSLSEMVILDLALVREIQHVKRT